MLALKNTCPKNLDAQSRGIWCEQVALEHYLRAGLILLKTRYRSPFAEIDLIFKTRQNEIVLVEVKSISSFDFILERVSKRQKQRLLRAYQYFLSKHDRVRIELAIVSQDGKLLIFDDVFG